MNLYIKVLKILLYYIFPLLIVYWLGILCRCNWYVVLIASLFLYVRGHFVIQFIIDAYSRYVRHKKGEKIIWYINISLLLIATLVISLLRESDFLPLLYIELFILIILFLTFIMPVHLLARRACQLNLSDSYLPGEIEFSRWLLRVYRNRKTGYMVQILLLICIAVLYTLQLTNDNLLSQSGLLVLIHTKQALCVLTSLLGLLLNLAFSVVYNYYCYYADPFTRGGGIFLPTFWLILVCFGCLAIYFI